MPTDRDRVLITADGYLADIDEMLRTEENRMTEGTDREVETKERGRDEPVGVHRRATSSAAMPRKVREEIEHQERKIETK